MINRILLAIALCFIATNAQADCVLKSALGANSDNATLVKAGGVIVATVTACNVNAAVRYLKLYDKATAPASTDTPVMRILIPVNNCVTVPFAGNNHAQFILGLGYRVVTGIADNDNTAVAASEQTWSICYR